jgi:hypothetical protein
MADVLMEEAVEQEDERPRSSGNLICHSHQAQSLP